MNVQEKYQLWLANVTDEELKTALDKATSLITENTEEFFDTFPRANSENNF